MQYKFGLQTNIQTVHHTTCKGNTNRPTSTHNTHNGMSTSFNFMWGMWAQTQI